MVVFFTFYGTGEFISQSLLPEELVKNLSHEDLLRYALGIQIRLEFMLRKKYTKSSESDPSLYQPCLFNEAEDLSESCESTSDLSETDQSEDKNSDQRNPEDKSDPKKKRGTRKKLPKNLKRHDNLKKLTDQEKSCHLHGCQRIVLGKKFINETLVFVPASAFISVNYVETCKCVECEISGSQNSFIHAEPERSIIPKSFASPSLLSQIIVSKYQDGLPLYRQQKIFERYQIPLDRTTLARWIIQVAKECQPLLKLMKECAQEQDVIHLDETGVQVLKEPNRRADQNSYMWVMKTATGAKLVVFEYHQNRSAKAAYEFLGDYKGTVVADAYNAYQTLQKGSSFTLAGCWAHVRRKFFDAEKYAKNAKVKNHQNQALVVLNRIRELYKIEKNLRESNADASKILMIRTTKSIPILDKLKAFLNQLAVDITPRSPLGKAVYYALNQWECLMCFTRNGTVPIDNNPAENAIRPFVIGRKNWLFSDTPKGAEASACMYSLIESAKANGICPQVYLEYIFTQIPNATSVDDYSKLMPHNCTHLNNKPETTAIPQ